MPPSLLSGVGSPLVGMPDEVVDAGMMNVRKAAEYFQWNLDYPALIAGIRAEADLQQLRHLPLREAPFHPPFPDALELHKVPPLSF